jgi:hypothetical protein
LAVLAAPAFAQKVKVDYDRDHDFAEVRSYAWGEIEQRAANTLAHEQILASLDKWLAEARLRKVGVGDSPDVVLTYHTSSEATIEIDFARLTPGEADLLINPDGIYARGTLVLDVRDGGDGRLVFHGVARGTLDAQPTKVLEKIDKAAYKLASKLGDSISRYTPNLNPFEGRLVTGIDVAGFKKTREYVIRREIRAMVGEPLDLSVVDRDVVRLNNLAIFAQVRPDVREDDEGLRLLYQLKETPPVIPYPAFSFTEENGFSIGAGVSAANLSGRDIALSGRALFGGTSNYNVLFNWPWITGNHFEFGFLGAHIERTDEVRGFNEDSDEILPWVGTYFAGDRGRFKVGPSFFRMRSDVPGITLSEDNEDHLYRLGVAVGWDTRDSWNLPHHGWLNELQVFRTGGFLGGDGDFWTVDADVRRFQPVGERRTLVLASLLTLQSGEAFVDVPSYLRYHLGGANTIRGYSVEDSKELSGKNQYLGTVELRQTVLQPRRYDILKWSFRFGLEVAALGDIGIAWDTSNQFATNRLRGGVGIGLRLLVPGSGQTRFDIAWSPEGGFQFHFGGGSKMARSRLRLR